MTVAAFVPDFESTPSSLFQRLAIPGRPQEVLTYAAFLRPQWLARAERLFRETETLTMRVGLDIPATPQQVLIDLRTLAQEQGRDIQLVKHRQAGVTFHPKFYAVRTEEHFAAVIGSSNPSGAAFGINIEANVVLSGMRGTPEDALVERLASDLDALIALRRSSGHLRIWQLPQEALPVIRPTRPRRTAELDVMETFASDGFEADAGFAESREIATFEAPLSGIFGYAANTGRQAGIYIPAAHRAAVLDAIDTYGSSVDLSWRFQTDDGATVFSCEEHRAPLQATGRGAGSHNLAITATRPIVAIPAVEHLEAVGVSDSDRVLVSYRLDLSGVRPRLWLIHRVRVRSDAFDASSVIG